MFEQAGDHAPARALPLACTPPLPELAPRGWCRWIDTPLEFPDDICAWTEAPVGREATYPVQPRSLVLQWQQVLLNAVMNSIEAMAGIDGRARELVVMTGRDGQSKCCS